MTLHDAIYQLNPAVATIRGDVAFDANDQVVEYDKAQAEALIASKQYQSDRSAAYPTYADQFDLLYHGGYDAWRSAIDAVKQQYPKPTE